MYNLFLKIKYRIAFNKCKAAAVKFIAGYKCLTENGKKRIDDLIRCVLKLYKIKQEMNYLLIDEYILFEDIINGLNGLASGNEVGFNLFEKLDTINKIKKVVNLIQGGENEVSC